MDLQIVVVSYNTRELLRACLRAIPDAVGGLKCVTSVVDNASSDGSAEMVKAEFSEVELIASSENLGFTRANNLVLNRADARFVLLLNPDTEAAPGSLETLARFMDAHPDCGACGPMLLNSDGSIQANGARFPTVLREFVCVTGLRRLAMRRYEIALGYGREDFTQPCAVDQVSGACLFVRTDVMRRVGPLDERFFMFYEEIEWCHRIRAAGFSVWYVPEARVTHHWMGSVKQQSRRMTAELFKSQLLYYQKTGGPLAVLAIRGIVMAGLLKNSLLHSAVAAKRTLRRAGLVSKASR